MEMACLVRKILMSNPMNSKIKTSVIMASNPTRSLRISLIDFQTMSAEISVVLVIVVEGILKMKLALAPLTPTRSMDIAFKRRKKIVMANAFKIVITIDITRAQSKPDNKLNSVSACLLYTSDAADE